MEHRKGQKDPSSDEDTKIDYAKSYFTREVVWPIRHIHQPAQLSGGAPRQVSTPVPMCVC